MACIYVSHQLNETLRSCLLHSLSGIFHLHISTLDRKFDILTCAAYKLIMTSLVTQNWYRYCMCASQLVEKLMLRLAGEKENVSSVLHSHGRSVQHNVDCNPWGRFWPKKVTPQSDFAKAVTESVTPVQRSGKYTNQRQHWNYQFRFLVLWYSTWHHDASLVPVGWISIDQACFSSTDVIHLDLFVLFFKP